RLMHHRVTNFEFRSLRKTQEKIPPCRRGHSWTPQERPRFPEDAKNRTVEEISRIFVPTPPRFRPRQVLSPHLPPHAIGRVVTIETQIESAIQLARELQQIACKLQTPQEKRQQAELDRMLQKPKDKVVMLQMTDQAFRSNTPWRAAEQLTHILDAQGVPRFFS